MSIGSAINITNNNPDSYVYLKGNNTTEGSIRFSIDSETGNTVIEKLISGIWQPTSFETGPESLWVGRNVGVAGVGHHIITKDSDGHWHFHAHSKWDGQTSIGDTRIIDAYNYEVRRVLQSDESGIFTGTSFGFAFPSSSHSIIGVVHFKTDTIVSTTSTRIQTWEGTDDTGALVFDQFYPASAFSPSTEDDLDLNGFLEFDAGIKR